VAPRPPPVRPPAVVKSHLRKLSGPAGEVDLNPAAEIARKKKSDDEPRIVIDEIAAGLRPTGGPDDVSALRATSKNVLRLRSPEIEHRRDAGSGAVINDRVVDAPGAHPSDDGFRDDSDYCRYRRDRQIVRARVPPAISGPAARLRHPYRRPARARSMPQKKPATPRRMSAADAATRPASTRPAPPGYDPTILSAPPRPPIPVPATPTTPSLTSSRLRPGPLPSLLNHLESHGP